jgi:hypothetical protein
MAEPWRRFVEAGYATAILSRRRPAAPIKSEMADTRGFAWVGRPRALLRAGAFPNGMRGAAVCGKLVAEDGFEPPTRGL